MSDSLVKRSPDDFDWPATIVLYIVLISLGIGMCFCLRKANRLIPNRFSFPLSDRGARQRGAHDLGVEEEGLLSNYSEDEDDAEVIEDQQALRDNNEIEEEEEFGTLQHHTNNNNNQKAPLNQQGEANFDMEDDDELYYNPYKDDHPAVNFNNNNNNNKK